MKTVGTSRPFSALLLLLGLLPAALVHAQGPRDYVRFPLQGDWKALFKERLQYVQDREELERLLRAFRANPAKFRLDPAAQRRLQSQLANPRLLQELQQAYGKNAGGLPFDPDPMKDLMPKTARPGPTEQKAPDPGAGPEAPANGGPPTPGAHALPRPFPMQPPPSGPPPEEGDSPYADWLRGRLEGLEDSRVGRVLRDSPAFQQGLLDLRESMLHSGADGGAPPWDLQKLTARLRGFNLSRFESGWEKLQGMELPSLPRPSLPFGQPGPPVGVPPVPSGPGALQAVLWLLLLAAGGFLLWRALARLKVGDGDKGGRAWRLGPWPVEPSHVATRADLVRAFEYLSLLVLGPAARTSNHLAVADGLAGDGPDAPRRRNAADELAVLYEQARYAPEEAGLGDEELAAARRDLCLLAGMARPC